MNLKNLGFSNFLEEGEMVTAIFRHPISNTLSKVIFHIVIWGALSWGFYFYWSGYYYDFTVANIYTWLFLIPFFIGIGKGFSIFMRWYANAILMTNESLVFSYFTHMFDRKIHRIDYWDLDDVELEKKGMSDYLGNRGDLIFAKVSGGKPIEFKRVNNPRKIISTIRKHKAKMLNEKNFSEEGALKDLLSQMVQTHTRTKGQPEAAREFHQEVVKKEEHIEKNFTREDFIRMREEELIKLKNDPEYINQTTHDDDIIEKTSVIKTENSEEELTEADFITMRNKELAKLRNHHKYTNDLTGDQDDVIEEVNNDTKKSFSIHRLKQLVAAKIPRHFRNELDDKPFDDDEVSIEVEKELDDTGGLEIEL